MEHVPPAQRAPSRPTGDLTLAEVLDPRTFTRSRRRFGAIKYCAVYCLRELDGDPSTLIALNRGYRPLGLTEEQRRALGPEYWLPAEPGLLDYARFPDRHFRRADLDLRAWDDPGALLTREVVDGAWHYFLWGIRPGPYMTPQALMGYRALVVEVFSPADLRRLAACVGRELGDLSEAL